MFWALPGRSETLDWPAAAIAALVSKHHWTRTLFTADEIASADLLNAALARLDPHSRYVPPRSEGSVRKLRSLGKGLGLHVLPLDGEYLALPYPGSPAAISSWCSGQATCDGKLLLAVDDQLIFSKKPLPKPRLGQRVRVLLAGQVFGAVQSVSLQNEVFERPGLEWVSLKDMDILRILQFRSGETAESVLKHLRHRDKSKPIAIDLRYCTGGSLIEALAVLDLFLSIGDRRFELHDAAGPMRSFPVEGIESPFGVTAVWISRWTASAAEILAMGLRNWAKVPLLGATSRGKCSVQRRFPLENGGGLILTLGRIRMDDGEGCHAVGLAPDLHLEDAKVFSSSELVHWSLSSPDDRRRWLCEPGLTRHRIAARVRAFQLNRVVGDHAEHGAALLSEHRRSGVVACSRISRDPKLDQPAGFDETLIEYTARRVESSADVMR